MPCWKSALILTIIIIIIQKICSVHISTLLESRNTGASPFYFTISVLGSFTCITQHTGPTALHPTRRTKQLWLSVLLKDTSAATGQAGIRTHILTTTRTWVQCTRPLGHDTSVSSWSEQTFRRAWNRCPSLRWTQCWCINNEPVDA